MNCRHCKAPLKSEFIDLGKSPLANAYLNSLAEADEEKWYPLRVMVCTNCWLVQTEDYTSSKDVFSGDYAYFSSFSTSWLKHAEDYVGMVTKKLGLSKQSHVVEIASNDGYLLQYFLKRGIPCLGIEPTASTAEAARDKGIETIEEFFGEALGRRLAQMGRSADLMVANNVLAHVPDINDFVKGFAELLKPAGVATFEFPHLLRLVEQNQFDTIYHEHFSYLSLTALKSVFAEAGMEVFDVEELSTHGGSLRLYTQKSSTGARKRSPSVHDLIAEEEAAGLQGLAFYSNFRVKVEGVRHNLVQFLNQAAAANKTVGAYGAAAKGNTLLNYAGVGPELIPWVVDRNPAKQGKILPGSHIPIVDEERIRIERPDYLLLLPWNLRDELVDQLGYVREWGCRFVTAVPSLLEL